MKVEVVELSPVSLELSVELPAAEVATALERAYRDLGGRAKIKGFRPGHVPRRILVQNFQGQVEREVASALVRDSLPLAIQNGKIEALGEPTSVQADPLETGKPFRYRARVEVKPKLKPKETRGLPLTRKKVEVTETQVAEELKRLQDSLSTLVPVEDRSVGLAGDWALIDYDLGLPPGEAPLELERNRDTPVEIAEGEITAGFVPQLRGVEVGQTIEFSHRFAADYKIERLRGREATFRVTLKGLRRREVPPLDDELVKDLDEPGLTTLEQLRTRVRERLQKEAEAQAQRDRNDQLIGELLRRNPFEAPPGLVERALEHQLQRFSDRVARAGIDPRSLPLDREQLRRTTSDRVKAELLLEAVALQEGLTVDQSDLDAYLVRTAENDRIALAKLKAQFSKSPSREALLAKLREEKALAFLLAEANIQGD
jgi:trigger factor